VVVYAVVITVMPRAAALHEPLQPFLVHNPHERIQAAAVRAIAAKGYQATSVRDICAEANISTATFHEHFTDKQEAVLTGVEAGVDQLMGYCQDAFKAAPSWPDAVWDTMATCTEWAALEPAFAHGTVVELLTIGPDALDLLRSLMDAFSLFLRPGYALLEPSATGALDETVSQRVFELMHTHLTHSPPDTLSALMPEVARTALIPFLGPAATEQFIARRQADC
jgi:AcrR family transcriptional regulator